MEGFTGPSQSDRRVTGGINPDKRGGIYEDSLSPSRILYLVSMHPRREGRSCEIRTVINKNQLRGDVCGMVCVACVLRVETVDLVDAPV